MKLNEDALKFFEYTIIKSKDKPETEIRIENKANFLPEVIVSRVIEFAKQNGLFFYGIRITKKFIIFKLF